METSLLQKLVGEVRRYHNRDFLKAAMAVCALSAYADNDVSMVERYSIDHAIENEPSLREFDKKKAVMILDDYIFELKQEGDAAKNILYNKVRRMAGDHKKSRTLMRVAYLIIDSDREVRDEEMEEFMNLGLLLDLEPSQIWAHLSANGV